MVFRRSDETDPVSSRWRRAHLELLAASGIPSEVAASDRRWIYVLLHGDDHLATGWDVSWISPAQAAELLAVLEHDLGNSTGYDLVRLLRQRVTC